MKAMKIVIALVLVLALFSGAACAKQASPTPEPTAVAKQSFEIDYEKIAGDTAQAKMESLTALLNEKAAGFAKIFSYSEKFEGETEEEGGIIYSYILMAYGDIKESEAAVQDYENNVLMILKQLTVYTAKFVADPNGKSIVQALAIMPGEYYLFTAGPTQTGELRLSPTESWMRSVETSKMELVSTEWLQQVLAYISQSEAPNQ